MMDASNSSYKIRKVKNTIMQSLITMSAILLFTPLVFIFFYLVKNGVEALSFNFFFNLPRPVGESGGGMAHALLGTLYMVAIAGIIAIPWGILGGIFLSEYSRNKLASFIRFCTDLLNGTPSIVFGIFVYAILVKPLKGFSALAGGVALALVILPMIVRATEEILKLVPTTIKHAGLSLGLPRWKVTLFIVVWESRRNLITGILLALSRAVGETAPLIFTAFGNMYFSYKLSKPMASLSVEIYNYAISPYKEWHNLAWTGSLVLIFIVFTLNIGSKYILNFSRKKQ